MDTKRKGSNDEKNLRDSSAASAESIDPTIAHASVAINTSRSYSLITLIKLDYTISHHWQNMK